MKGSDININNNFSSCNFLNSNISKGYNFNHNNNNLSTGFDNNNDIEIKNS